ncbi:MAG: FeoB-associated Cys-rich membrane protein [Lentisphaeria bacterium]|nr:FeoB-associated Cys-rich membrane protein [Lentisphaeria bacterium]
MYDWLCENGGTLLVGSLLIAVIALIGVSLARKRRSGGCGCGCACCDKDCRR